MEFEEAKARLICHAVGFNDYEKITTWQELEEKAAFEASEASAKAQWLQDIQRVAEQHNEEDGA